MEETCLCITCGNNHQGTCTTEAHYFYWYPQDNQNPKEVQIVGDWFMWLKKEKMTRGVTENGNPFFSIALALNAGKHEYKYVVDGVWRYDKDSPYVQNSGNGSFFQVFPKSAYWQKGNSKDIKITSNICNQGLKIIGSWDNWSEQKQMTKIYNTLKGSFENVIFLNLQPLKKYQFKFKIGNQYLIDETLPTTVNQLGTFNNYIIIFRHKIRVETPRQKSMRSLVATPRKLFSGKCFFWKRIDNSCQMPYEKVQGHSMCSIGENIYIYGGKARNQFYNSLIKIDSSFKKSELLEVVPDGRAFHSMIAYGNKIIIYGGHNNVILEDYHFFNVIDCVWQTPQKIPKSKQQKLQKQSCVRYRNSLVFFGGYFCPPDIEYDLHIQQIQVLDLQKMQWIQNIDIKGQLPTGRFAHTACLIGPNMYIFGGIYNASDKYSYYNQSLNLNDLWKIDLDNDPLQWEQIKPNGLPPAPRHGHTMNNLGNILIIFAGQDDFNTFLNDLVVYNIISNEWVRPLIQGSIPRARSNHASTNLQDDKIVIFGGKTVDNAKNRSIYVLKPIERINGIGSIEEDESD